MALVRDPQAAGHREFDVLIIGGGIYGITLALEAGLRGLKTLLIEQGDFGEKTSFNSLKIIHGGLRYLQSLDLHRFRESVGERTWFLRHFPERVHPLPCFMPLYGNGMRRPSVFRGALLANHLLALRRNAGIDPDHHLPMGKVVGVAQSREIFPLLDTEGLKGGAVWYDAFMPDSQLLVMDLLQRASSLGATALNYVRATELLLDGQGRVEGVRALDRETDTSLVFRAALVINAAGPWCREVVAGIRGEKEELFRPSLAWNVLFNRQALSDHALAVQAREPGSRLYFITPWKGKIFAGTGHEPWLGGPDRPMPDHGQLKGFITALNRAVPGLELSLGDVSRIFAGLLPTVARGSNKLTKREVIVDHGAEGGPTGLYSVGGIKFTTARLVAEKILGLAGCAGPLQQMTEQVKSSYTVPRGDDRLAPYRELLARDGSIVHLDDLVFRRSTLWERGGQAMGLVEELCTLFPWDRERRQRELTKCRACLASLPLEGAKEATR